MGKKKRKKKVKLIHIFLSFLFLYIAIIYYNQNSMLKELEAKKEQNIVEIDKLKDEIEDLNSQIENSNSLEFIERIARDDLGMVKPREIIYIDKNKKKGSIFKSD
jgi:cell division protein DivIC